MPRAKTPKKSCDKYHVCLTTAQRDRLLELTKNGTASAKKILHARILLLADEVHPDGQRPDSYITDVLNIHRRTVVRIRQRFVEQGEEHALNRKPRQTPPTPVKLDSAGEAHLVALVCSEPPAGHKRWSLSLLAQELTRLEVVTSICPETVRRALKKTNLSPGKLSDTASPPRTERGSSSRWKTSFKSMKSQTPTSTR
jgi:hypothetical protein